MDHRPDIGVFVGDGHYGCAPMVEGLRARDLHLVSKLRGNAVLWVPYTGLPCKGPGRPRKYAGRFDRAGIPDLPAVDLEDEGRRLHHAQLYYKPFQRLLRVVFVLDIDADPEMACPVTLFATDPEMAPERIYRIYRDRFQIEFNFRDAKQHLGLAACQARTAARHYFHVNAVLAALAWTRLELRQAADQARAAFRWPMSSSNPSCNWCCSGFLTRTGWAAPSNNTRRPCRPSWIWAKSSRHRLEPVANPEGFVAAVPIPSHPRPPSDRAGWRPLLISKTVHTIVIYYRWLSLCRT